MKRMTPSRKVQQREDHDKGLLHVQDQAEPEGPPSRLADEVEMRTSADLASDPTTERSLALDAPLSASIAIMGDAVVGRTVLTLQVRHAPSQA